MIAAWTSGIPSRNVPSMTRAKRLPRLALMRGKKSSARSSAAVLMRFVNNPGACRGHLGEGLLIS